jgi:hypothetical protein
VQTAFVNREGLIIAKNYGPLRDILQRMNLAQPTVGV